MAAGTIASARVLQARTRWEQTNVRVGLMLDWDDVQAVATRSLSRQTLPHLLAHFREHGATHLSMPELTLKRLLDRGQVSVDSGEDAERVYLRAQTSALAELVATELQTRLPHLDARACREPEPRLSFEGDLPTVAEVGLGFDPAHFALAQEAGMAPVARPIGYSWVQPAMIERTLNQAAQLGAKIVAVQGMMTPGFEFYVESTVESLKRNHLCYAYFRESRHQRGDWHLAKSLVEARQVLLAHEFEPEELLLEDAGTISRRWANLTVEAGVRLCCLRFFRVIHAGDPMEAMDYVGLLATALRRAGLSLSPAPETNLQAALPDQDEKILSVTGLSIAGAAGLAADFLPLPDQLKLLGTGLGAITLASLPYLEQNTRAQHDHDHGHDDHHHHDHDHDHHHHGHGDDHQHNHSHGPGPKTAYASKGLALAASIAYPAAGAASNGTEPVSALARAALTSVAGATALNATLFDAGYLLGVEEYRGFNLDWLLPLGLATIGTLSEQRGRKRWLPVGALIWTAWRRMRQRGDDDPLARLDREHRQDHTHHISAFQQRLGDSKMALSPQPLRKWSFLAPLGVVSAALFRKYGRETPAAIASACAVAGGTATLAGFRNMQRPFQRTVEGRMQGWIIGSALAGMVWLGAWFLRKLGQSR